MGCTHSCSSSTKSLKDTSVPSDCGCNLPPRPRLVQLLDKLRRNLKRHLRPKKRRFVGFQRGCGVRTALLRPMPRCSSFGSCGSLLTPTKPTPSDSHYAKWKCMFEHAGGKRLTATAQRPHDISEALSGQTTPRGFPSHTDARRCPLPQPVPAQVYRRLSFRLPSNSSSSLKRLSARQKAAQAKLEAQLQRELCDLEDYYGGFHYARRNERRI